LTGKAKTKKITFSNTADVEDPLTENQRIAVAISSEESEGTAYDTWIISPKFECPIFSFNDFNNSLGRDERRDAGVYEIKQEATLNYTEECSEEILSVNYKVSNDESRVTTGLSTDNYSGTGMWSGYGSLPSQSEGVFVSIEESFAGADSAAGSLVDVCGFTATQEKLGDIAESREISEAVVMIPFLDRGDAPLSQFVREDSGNMVASTTSTDERVITPERVNPTAPIIETEGQQVRVTNVDGRNFISISREEFTRQRSNIENGLPAVTIADNATLEAPIQETTISRMIKMMKKYNLPPRYDFITYPPKAGELPFIMYFFEFTQTLGKQDLADIWQGVKPTIARQSEMESVEITHELGPNEFFEGNKIPEGVRWMVFKVKRKASSDYFEMVSDSAEDSRFKFDFNVGKKKPEYSYNYPYDFFSLVEMVKIESGIDIETDPENLTKIRNRNQEQ
jgi:hypothetical protein